MTNGARPWRLINHMRSSTARARRMTSYILSACSSLKPSDWWRLGPPFASICAALRAILLNVDRDAVDGQGGLLDGFRDGRMGSDARPDLEGCRLEELGQRGLGNELGGIRAEDEDADQFVRVRVADDLHEALGLTEDHALGIARQREFPDLDVQSLVARLLFRQSETRHLRVAVGRSRDSVVVERFGVLARDVLHDVLAFVIRDVRQQEVADDVARGVHIGVPGAVVFVGFDVALLELDVQLLQAEAIGDAFATDRDQHPLRRDGLDLRAGLDRDRHLPIGLLQAVRLDLRPGQNLDATFAEDFRQLRTHLGILEREQGRQELDEGHVHPVAVVDAGKLGPDRAGTDDHDRLRHLVEVDRVVAVDHAIAVHRKSGQGLGSRSGRHHQVLGVHHLAAVLDRHRVLGLDDALALEHGYLVLLQQELDTAPELVDHRLLALQDRRPIDLEAVSFQAEGGGGVDLVRQLRGMKERLGRDATPVQAGASDLLLLDDRNFEPELGSTNSADIPGGATADDGDIERFIRHTSRLYPPFGGWLGLQHRQRRRQLEVLGEVVRRLVYGVFVLGVGQRHRLVRRDPALFDRVAIGRQPLGNRQVQVAIAKEKVLLYRALAEGLDPDQLAAVTVLDRAGRDLRGARRVLVDEDHQRIRVRVAVAGHLAHVFLAATFDQDGGRPAADELADDFVGLVDVSTRVVAQVEQDHVDRPLQVVRQRLVELGPRSGAEFEDADIEHPVVEDMGGDAGDVDFLARQIESQRLAVATHLDLDLRVRDAADLVDSR